MNNYASSRDESIEELLSSYRQTAKAFMESAQLLAQQESDIHASAVFVLRYIAEHSGVSPHDIATYLGVSNAAISRQIAICRKKGYIRTERDVENRRCILLRITADGKALVERVDHAMHAYFMELFCSFSDDQINTMIATNAVVRRAIERH